MTFTEEDLSLVLRQVADEAPLECSTFTTTRRTSRRRLAATLVSAAAVVIMGVGATVLLAGQQPDRNDRDSAGGLRTSAAAPTSPTPTAVPIASTFTPTAQQRRQLVSIGDRAGSLNGDPTPRISVVGTTAARLRERRPSLLLGFSVTATRKPGALLGSDEMWVVWMRGSFDAVGPPVLIDLVDSRTMRDLGGTFGQPGDNSDPDQLADLGTVVTLR